MITKLAVIAVAGLFAAASSAVLAQGRVDRDPGASGYSGSREMGSGNRAARNRERTYMGRRYSRRERDRDRYRDRDRDRDRGGGYH